MALVVCEAFEDIFEGVEFERGKAFGCEFEGLEVVLVTGMVVVVV